MICVNNVDTLARITRQAYRLWELSLCSPLVLDSDDSVRWKYSSPNIVDYGAIIGLRRAVGRPPSIRCPLLRSQIRNCQETLGGKNPTVDMHRRHTISRHLISCAFLTPGQPKEKKAVGKQEDYNQYLSAVCSTCLEDRTVSAPVLRFGQSQGYI